MKHNIFQGIQVAFTTYNILNKHKKLLVYMTVPMVLQFIFYMVAPHHALSYTYNLLHPTITVWLGVALIRHIHHILKHQSESWVSSMHDTYSRAWSIAWWGLTASFLIALSYWAESLISKTMLDTAVVTLPFMVLWTLLTAFIIAIIASESLPLLGMIKHAVTLIKTYALEIIGGLGIFVSLLLIPILAAAFLRLIGILAGNIIYHGIILGVIIIFHTATTIFCALLHRHHQRKVSRDIIIDIRTLYMP